MSTAHRLPSLIELFGDRGYLIGDVQLRPERGWSADVGLAYRHSAAHWRTRLEVRGFISNMEDLISYVRTAQLQLVPQNIGQADLIGAELGASTQLGPVSANLAWTLLHSRDRDRQRALPLRPRHQAHASMHYASDSWGAAGPLWATIDLSFVGENFVDPANQVQIPGRLVMGASVGMRLLEERIELRLSVRDILDERPFDEVGFPLPGRRFAAELIWRERAE